jgi:hypothetical protein
MAEMSLIPLDDYLHLKGFTYSRFVDDIHIFCSCYDNAQAAVYEVAGFLDKSAKDSYKGDWSQLGDALQREREYHNGKRTPTRRDYARLRQARTHSSLGPCRSTNSPIEFCLGKDNRVSNEKRA